MAINTIKATMQMRRGAEANFDPDQMTAGEWGVSTDSKKVWMCFAPGIVRRMATYEAFEADMVEIQNILATCQDIQKAVEAFEKLAEKHKNDAAVSASTAQQQAALSKTYANSSNAYSQQAKNSADTSAEYLTKVEKAGDDAVQAIQDALDIDAPNFQIDLTTGHLMYSGGRFTFNVNSSGHLMWGLAV